MNDFGIIIGVLVGAYFIYNMNKPPAPQSTPGGQAISVNPRLILATGSNPGMGPTQQAPMPVNSLSLAKGAMLTDIAPAVINPTGFTLADVGYAPTSGPTQSLGRCLPNGTCYP
jgi:hypothetical protein